MPPLARKVGKIAGIVALIASAAGALFSITAPDAARVLADEVQALVSGAKPPPCADLEAKERYICWDGAIEKAKGRSIPSALFLLEAFSKASPEFIQVCHNHAHRIGKQAYAAFRDGEELKASSAMQLCDFGFYHGFMTEFIAVSSDPLEMRAFCNAMENAEEEDGSRSYSRDACFHGIGHGSVERHDPSEWGDPKAVLSQTLTLCRSAAATNNDYEKCAGGAYNGMSYGTYGKQILDKNDPFGICRGLSDADVPAECYGNLAAVVFDLTENRKLQQGIDLARSYQHYPYFERALATFAAMSARQPNSQEDSMRACGALPDHLAYHCLWGYVSGLIQAEVPDTRQQKAYALCAGALVPDTMRITCFEAAFNQLSDFWSDEKIAGSCPLAPSQGIAACSEALVIWKEKRAQR